MTSVEFLMFPVTPSEICVRDLLLFLVNQKNQGEHMFVFSSLLKNK